VSTYIGLLTKRPGRYYRATFPDFPGQGASGSTLEEAQKLASESLESHVARLHQQGISLPLPGLLEEVRDRAPDKEAMVFRVSVANGWANIERGDVSHARAAGSHLQAHKRLSVASGVPCRTPPREPE
jgi:predicted RNase H-like HicB family nuclease